MKGEGWYVSFELTETFDKAIPQPCIYVVCSIRPSQNFAVHTYTYCTDPFFFWRLLHWSFHRADDAYVEKLAPNFLAGRQKKSDMHRCSSKASRRSVPKNLRLSFVTDPV